MIELLTNIAILTGIPTGMLLLLFWHELGHALPVLLTGGRAHIIIGSHDGQTVMLGRLSITFGTDGLKNTFIFGQVQASGLDSKFVQTMNVLGGPIMTVIAIFVIGFLTTAAEGLLFIVLVNLLLAEIYRAYQTIFPKTYSRGPYKSRKSDGKRFLELIRS